MSHDPPASGSDPVAVSPPLRSVSRHYSLSSKLLCAGLLLGLLGGCVQVSEWLGGSFDSESKQAEVMRHRQEYLVSRSPEALRWLVSNRLKNGMSKSEVDALIGESGEREFNDKEVLGQGGPYRSDDLVYRWGPDSEGNSYLFVFRDDSLLNVENFARDLSQINTTRIGFQLSSDDF